MKAEIASALVAAGFVVLVVVMLESMHYLRHPAPRPLFCCDVLGNAQEYRAADTAGACLARGGEPLMDRDIGVYIACL